MAKLSGISTPSLTFDEGAAAGTPAANDVVLYAKSDGLLYSKDDAGVETVVSGAGSVATDAIWDAAGDLVQGTGSNTAARLALGAAGTVVRSTGSTNAYAYPPGYEFNRVEITAQVTVTGTAEGSETTIVTGGSVSYDGSTAVDIEFCASRVTLAAGAVDRPAIFTLYEDSTALGRLCTLTSPVATQTFRFPIFARFRRTPTAGSHTYTVKAWKNNSGDTFTVDAGLGGSGANMPVYVRVVKA